MKLHGNAALNLNKRKLLAGRVVEEGWSLTSAAAAAEVSVPTARKWARRYRADGLVIHSDRGVQFTSWAFSRKVRDAGLAPSMGAVGSA